MKNAKIEQLLSRCAENMRSAVVAAFEEGQRIGVETGVQMGTEQERARVLSVCPETYWIPWIGCDSRVVTW
jgi:hypothetical protein